MSKLFRRLIKITAYLAGGLVIMLAIAVGLFRLLLPRLPEYQDEIKGWASAAIGMTVEFSGMDARWGLSGPEVEFYDAELISADSAARFVAADEVSVGVGLMRLLVDRKFVVDRIVVRDTSVEVRQQENGEWWVQGGPVESLLPARPGGGSGDVGRIEVIGEDIELLLLQPGDVAPKRFDVTRLLATRDDVRMAIDASIDLPQSLGRRLTVHATQLLTELPENRSWDISATIEDLDLAGVTALQPAEAARFNSGTGDVDLSLAFSSRNLRSATADIDIDGIGIAGLSNLALQGRLEFLNDDDGWLLAADDLTATTPTGQWPATTLRFEATTNDDGRITSIDAQASYIDFSHLPVVEPWLNDEQRELLAGFEPSGVIRDLSVTLTGLDTDARGYDVSVRFENLGVDSGGTRPGIRGLSGSLRADTSGGRLELNSDDLEITAPAALGQPLRLDETSGTVIWRRSNRGTTVLSDGIVLGNAFLDSKTSIEVTFTDGWDSPFVDLESEFSISDIAAVSALVPYMEKRPRISQWFQEGLLSGRVRGGRATLHGPVDRLPFTGDEGQMRIQGTIEDAVIVYQPGWPAAEVIEADLVLENMSLRSNRNRFVNVGNEIVDAQLEIGNFRQPVLTFSSRATGTMESLRQLCLQSPINDMFGGQLEKVSVNGDAEASFDLRVPIREARNFSFTAQIRTDDASLAFQGFNPPLSSLNGGITIERDDVRSNALSGVFLGQPISIELEQAPPDLPSFRVVASASGAATADAFGREFGLPVNNRVSGATAFSATLMFPRGDQESPSPFTIDIRTDLAGIGIDLPAPLGKRHDQLIDVNARILLPKGGEQIETTGSAGDLMSWHVGLVRDASWDIDRGIVVFGGDGDEFAGPETRGLHLRGTTDYVRVQDWFDLAHESEAQFGIAERIRSIDATVENLHVLGQHLVNHRVRVDRSANEWLIQMDGDKVQGSFWVPYDLNSGQPIVVDAERLLFPGDDEESDRPSPRVDPRSMPPITIKAGAMAFGNRNLGAVEASFRHTADGLVAEGVVAKDDTFEIVGSASWQIDETDPLGNRSFVSATLTSTDVEKTMQRLDYDPGIRSEELSLLLDLSWSGGPSSKLMESLDGNVRVNIGAGQLADVRPGAGRVFGLMSVAALPRRLSLDFTDVFGRGFGFDAIRGDFNLVDGESYTCNLSLEGPAADIGIVGRAGLVSREYDQAAIISANFGSALPVAGAIVAGPQVAAALLIFSQIFKKPLREVSQVYYSIGGTFDDPIMEATTAELFGQRGARTGCIEDGE